MSDKIIWFDPYAFINNSFWERVWKERLEEHKKQVENLGSSELAWLTAMRDADWEAERYFKNMDDFDSSVAAINFLQRLCAEANRKWDFDSITLERKKINIGEKLMLCVSELSEALEGDRKDLMDNHLPQYKMFKVELVDCLIRIFHLAGALEFTDLGEIFKAKMIYNAQREDHKLENRASEGGKKY